MSAPAGQSDAPVLTAHRAGLSGCHRCGRVWPQDQARCHRCGAHLVAPDRRGLQKVWAWWLAGLIAYIPANVFPMMSTQTFAGLAGNSEATILGGVVELMHYGNYDIALIVFVASVIVPVGKFLAIAWLAVVVTGHRVKITIDRHRRGHGQGRATPAMSSAQASPSRRKPSRS